MTLKHPAQIVAICGRNESLKRQVEALVSSFGTGGNVIIHPVGFTTEMDEYMSASDIVVGKPGGLTTSEALAKGLAFVVFCPIPGQEDRNSHHLMMKGAGLRCDDIEVLAYMLDELIGNPDALAHMQAQALAFAHPTAALDIVTRIQALHLV
jgi:processive 1,2-diacylglycerol beta-glucosyltransferase